MITAVLLPNQLVVLLCVQNNLLANLYIFTQPIYVYEATQQHRPSFSYLPVALFVLPMLTVFHASCIISSLYAMVRITRIGCTEDGSSLNFLTIQFLASRTIKESWLSADVFVPGVKCNLICQYPRTSCLTVVFILTLFMVHKVWQWEISRDYTL